MRKGNVERVQDRREDFRSFAEFRVAMLQEADADNCPEWQCAIAGKG
jgi:hypothetical protein